MSFYLFNNAVSSLKYGFILAFFFSGFSLSAQQFSAVQNNVSGLPCDSITHSGTINGDQVIHVGDIPNLLLENTPPEGGSGKIKYLWMEYLELGSMPGQWYPILSATSASYQPGPLLATRRFVRCATREGCTSWKQSNIITVAVKTADF